jgi:hypothetical protein
VALPHRFDKKGEKSMGLFSKIFGDYSEKELKKISHYVSKINELEPVMETLSDSDLRAKTEEFKNRFKLECGYACPNEKELCNIILDMCYKNNNTKQFAWDICGDIIIENLLEKNCYIINYPVKDENGDIQFGGNKFKMCERIVNGDEDI